MKASTTLNPAHKFILIYLVLMNYSVVTIFFFSPRSELHGFSTNGILFGITLLILTLAFFYFGITIITPTYFVLYLVFLSWAAFSTLWSIDKILTIREVLRLLPGLLAFSICYRSMSQEQAMKFVRYLFYMARYLLIALFMSLLIAHVLGIRSMDAFFDLESKGSTGSFSLNYSICILFIGYVFIFKKEIPVRYVDYGLLGTVYAYFLAQLSRTYLLAVIASSILAICMRRGDDPINKRSIFKFVSFCFIIYGASVLFITTYSPVKGVMFWRPERVTFQDVFFNPLILLDEHVVRTSGRFTKWGYFIEQLHRSNNAIIGGGLGSAKAILSSPLTGLLGGYYSHGIFAQYYGELGIVGFCLYCAFMLSTFLYYFRQYSRGKTLFHQKLTALVIVYLTGLVLGSITYTALDRPQANYILFTLFALTHGACSYKTVKK